MATTYISQPSIKIAGSDASKDLMNDIVQIAIEQSLHLPAMFTLIIRNSKFPGNANDKFWQHDSIFEIGKEIEVGFISSTTEDKEFDDRNEGTVIKGEITAIETQFTSGSDAPIIIRGYDVSHRLHRGRFNRSFQDKTDSDIVNNIIGEVGISANTVDSTTPVHEYVFQENQTNMEFLRERAARNGYELFVQDGKLNFRKPSSDATVDLTWLKDLYDFRVRVSSAEQVSSVEVRGWDYTKKEPIVSTKNTDQVLTSTDYGKGKSTSSKFSGKPTNPKVIVVDHPIASTAEADTIAQALVNELGGEFVVADARAEGNPKLCPGKVIKLKEMGKYSGDYYVTETRHIYEERVYITEFSVRGLRGGDLFATLAPPTRLQPGQTLMVGQVTDNNDPKKWGRVRVWFPTLTPKEGEDAHASYWARVVAIGAGPDRGFDVLPEIDDEVLVAFEHGDIHRPYVIGGVWNGKDAPPTVVTDSVVDGKVRLRTFKTRTGHQLQFVEEDKGAVKKGIYLDTKEKYYLHFNDTEEFIEIKTKGGFLIRLDNKNKKIQAKTAGGHEAVLDDQGKKIELKSSGGHKVTLDDNGRSIDVTSSGDINLKAGPGKNINLDAMKINLKGQTNIALTVGGNKLEISIASVDLKSTAMTTVEGTMTTIKGSATVSVSAASISLG